ncbi:MAG: ABC transporter ATP-binding protein [Clostridia bacterium]|nr:ABC transporter ATP-binding protein [Clostridia bacterium]
MSEKRHGPGGPGPRPGGRPGGPMGARLNAEKPKNTKRTLFRLARYIGKSGWVLVGLLAIMLVVTVVEILNPFFQQKAIDTITLVDGKLAVDLRAMVGYLAAIGGTFVFSATLSYFQGLLAAKLSQTTVFTMRNELFSKISRLPISYTDTHRHGDIMSRMTNDIENVSNAVSQSIATLFSAVLTLIGALVMMLYYSPLLTAVAITIIPMTLLVSSVLAKFMRKYFVAQQRILGRLNSNVEESVTGYKTVVAYGKEADAIASFAENAQELRTTSIKARVWGSIMGPIMNFLGNFHYVLLAALGGYMVLSGRGRITVGSIQAMLQYSKKFSQPINMIANQYSTILTALAGAERIFEIMDSANEVDTGRSDIRVEDIRGDITFENLQFGYVPGEPVLKGFDLEVKAGQKIAIVGATGSGKTTVVNLLTRFYELDGGRITIDGVDITEIPKNTLRHAIAIVLQDTVLFSDTIGANIRYGRDNATDESVRTAARTAMADVFIDRLPEGYETRLTESGSNLSEGQRQLLSISRAVLADPKILILDEATSSVDTRTELRLQQAMNNLMKGRTSLIIAHRLSTIRDADKIVVVSDGRIVEVGSHDELLAKGGQYSKLYSSQFAGVAI